MINEIIFDTAVTSQYIDVICDECYANFLRTKKNIKVSRRNHRKDLCASCAAKNRVSKTPQCHSDFWSSPEKRESHGKIIKNSNKYREGVKRRPNISGAANPMYGKKASTETREKMSLARMGKIGKNATAWKGGQQSLNKQLKRAIQTRFKWFSRVIQRDKLCQNCGNTKNLDAHHVKPFANIVKEELGKCDLPFENDDQRFMYLITLSNITDQKLINGITLCRDCHKKVHQNWGSHNPEVQNA